MIQESENENKSKIGREIAEIFKLPVKSELKPGEKFKFQPLYLQQLHQHLKSIIMLPSWIIPEIY